MSEELLEFLKYITKIFNKRWEIVKKLRDKYAEGENRCAILRIIGENSRTVSLKLVEVEGKVYIALVEGEIPKPTTILTLREDTFWKIVLGKRSLVECIFSRTDPVIVEGEFMLRDIHLFAKAEREVRKILKKMGVYG